MSVNNDIWADIFGSGYEYLDWIESIRFKKGADWDVAGEVAISYVSQDDDGIVLDEVFTAEEVFKAYEVIDTSGYQHCGGCDLSDPDVCTTDMVLQQLVYGDVIFG
jgi:hypothetical protein